ncbi:cytochrome c [Flavobacterium agrisoli]|uniref:Cytochrome c n=1 Tax=Flavobacterium agrisoli TaxID=2793066 RepID=A0A934UJZ0_9FLAO|nr:cytochrome c [Flavobacterium agrisoli]MBK0369915.1 cytochrome c [Flavobacterium agrisoli]
MQSKLISMAVFALLLASCGSKKAAPTAPVTTTEAVSNEMAKEVVAGQNLYENNCGKCHKLYAPTEYSKTDWKPILLRMQKKAHLDDTQMASIGTYIHSKL